MQVPFTKALRPVLSIRALHHVVTVALPQTDDKGRADRVRFPAGVGGSLGMGPPGRGGAYATNDAYRLLGPLHRVVSAPTACELSASRGQPSAVPEGRDAGDVHAA